MDQKYNVIFARGARRPDAQPAKKNAEKLSPVMPAVPEEVLGPVLPVGAVFEPDLAEVVEGQLNPTPAQVTPPPPSVAVETIAREAVEVPSAEVQAQVPVQAPTPVTERVKEPAKEQATEQAQAPADTLTMLNRIVEPNPPHLERERVLQAGAGGPHGAPYKMLRTQVMRRLEKINANSLAIVGTTDGTGKTLTAINLAIAIAADPDRTALLVDLDLRRPSVHRRLGLDPAVGIEDCLRNGRPLKDAMLRLAGYDRLVVLPARERCEDSSELLSAKRTHELIAEMRNRYADRVLIFDLPPVLQSDDVLAFARHVQSALIVVGECQTRRRDLMRTVELLHDLPIVGTVLNGARSAVDTYY